MRDARLPRPTPALAVLVLLLCVAVACGAVIVGAYPFGNANDSDRCRVAPPLPSRGGPFTAEDAHVSAEHTWVPLGVVCTFDSDHDSIGPQQTHHQSWPATALAILAAVVGAAALAELLATLRSSAVGAAGVAPHRRRPGRRVRIGT